jgi:predicted amidohydrolase
MEVMKNSEMLVSTLQPITRAIYQENLDDLIDLIKKSDSTLIIAPELYLTNFDYDNFENAAAFYERAVEALKEIVKDKVLVLTLTVKDNNDFFNRAVVIHKHQIVHQQDKYKLFKLGDEEKYFKAGDKDKIVPFKINGIKYALLICFELRFKELWKQIEGVDVVLIPARWGRSRTEHLETLSRALAIMNQTFVVVSNSADEDMALASAIISPWGEVVSSQEKEVIEEMISFKEIKRVRRLINIS